MELSAKSCQLRAESFPIELTTSGHRASHRGSRKELPLADRHPSAIKRNRQNEKRRERNRVIVSRMRSQVRKVRTAVANSDTGVAETELRVAIKELQKAATKGVLHKNAANRRVARLSRAVAALGK